MSQAFSRQGEMMYDDVCWCNASQGAKSHWRRCDIPLQQRFVQSVDDATESFEGTPHELRFPDRRETLYRSLQALATLAIRFQSGPGLTASIELGRMVCPHVRFQFALKQGTKECINMCARNCKWHLCNYTVRVYIYIYLFIYILVTCKYQILLVWLWFDLISELTYAYVHLCHLSLCVCVASGMIYRYAIICETLHLHIHKTF